jgi:hypothetical protein
MSLTFKLKQAKLLVEFFGEDEETEITVVEGDETAHSGYGLYAYYSDYPDEGTFYLGD